MKIVLASILLISTVECLHAASEPKDDRFRRPVPIEGNQKAPEFADIADWINSKPLTMADLKGKVVVVHFMAFG